jgi:trypsin
MILRSSVLRPVALLVGALVVASCSAGSEAPTPSEDEARTGRARTAIVKGKESDASQDAVVLVMHYDAVQKGGGGAAGCTGILLTPKLVLTARHCVAVTDDGAACTAEGTATSGGVIRGDHNPSALFVFSGRERPDLISGVDRAIRGVEIFSSGSKTLCNNDLALILLSKPVEGAMIAPVRLEDSPRKDELVTVVGWGVTEKTPDPDIRQQRTGVKILDVGPMKDLGTAEFRVGESTCSGDSGGPALAASGAVLGVLSRGGNGTGTSGVDNCIEGENIFTSAAGHASTLRAAYEKAGQEPWIEGMPNPLLGKLGESCEADGACQSSICNLGAKSCTQACDAAPCPGGYSCGAADGRRLCLKNEEEDEGCSASGSSGSAPERGSTSIALAFLALAVARRRAARSR